MLSWNCSGGCDWDPDKGSDVCDPGEGYVSVLMKRATLYQRFQGALFILSIKVDIVIQSNNEVQGILDLTRIIQV